MSTLHSFTEEVSTDPYTVAISPSTGYGYFEHGARGEEGGAGGLWFEGKELVDFDGLPFLPREVAYALVCAGFAVPSDFTAGAF